MEDIRRAAIAAYATFTEEEKREMESEFRSMDKDGDGKISLHEFMAHSDQHTQSFFSLLDQNHDGVLQFDEVKTLSYITSSGRPFCAACKEFIPALFFTCTKCRFASTTVANTFNLCIPCYQGRSFEHEHTDFADNYTLLLKLQARRPSRAIPPRSAQSSSNTQPSQSGQSRPRRRTRMNAAMKNILRRIGETVSGAAAVTGLALSLNSIIPNNTGVEGGRGDDDNYYDEDYDNNDDDVADAAANSDADDPSQS
ncbi:hypothetical protein QN277_027182 [Acacia crassicarpa]|uniref:EF-hand domain-containing protein n=1 Tax=Acacia crassicarpa TaxID=499986 RepID=A0AAE1J990_9FABA|nr:hypothetical protein QN277_027182 [Acacia crassicarpa]